MADMAQLHGVEALKQRLKSRPPAAFRRLCEVLKLGGAIILRDSQLIVPVDQGNLKASGYCRSEVHGLVVEVEVGYTANYALYVHENLDALHGQAFNIAYADLITEGVEHSRGADQQAKFLETPFHIDRPEIMDMARTAVKG